MLSRLCCCIPKCRKDEVTAVATPDDFDEKTGVEIVNGEVLWLDYSHGTLKDVPPQVFAYERTLERLILSSNMITDLAPNLFHCHGIKELALNSNDLREIPSAIESMKSLASLDLARNMIVELPESIKNCKNLVRLDISNNNVPGLPEIICLCVHLEELYLNALNLKFLPANIARLTKLRILEIRDNALQHTPIGLGKLFALQRLDFGGNDLTEVCDIIGTLTNLTELLADANTVAGLKKNIGNLSKLGYLDLGGNKLTELPPELGKCTNLTDLALESNYLKKLPNSLCKLENLIILRVNRNKLESLPDDIGKLKNLVELYAQENFLETLPPSVGLLRKLHSLYLDDNNLVALPKEIGSCTSLSILSVTNNFLVEIPSEVGHLSALKVVSLVNNGIANLPVSIVGLTELGGIWLAEAQNKPLYPLNRDLDAASGQHVMTCCLLPQVIQQCLPPEAKPADEEDKPVPKRSARRIRFENESDSPPGDHPSILNGGLMRAPTPYPKDFRVLAKHAAHAHAHARNKGQNGGAKFVPNEPLYEGDANEELMESHANRVSNVNNLSRRLQTNCQVVEIVASDIEDGSDEDAAVIDQTQSSMYPEFPMARPGTSAGLPDQLDATFMMVSSPPEIPLDDLRPQSSYKNNPSSSKANLPHEIPLDGLRPVGKTPPPYHIAAQRAAILRSSGGAGSGNHPLMIRPSEIIAKLRENPPSSSAGFAVEETDQTHDEDVRRNYYLDLNKPIEGTGDHLPFENIQEDDNANLTSTKHQLNVTFDVRSEPSYGLENVKTPLSTSKQSSFKESRIPTSQKQMVDPSSPRSTSVKHLQQIIPDSQPKAEDVSLMIPTTPIVLDPVPPMRKYNSSVPSEIPKMNPGNRFLSMGSFGKSDNAKVKMNPASSASKIKYSPTFGMVQKSDARPPKDGERRKSGSRIPKFGSGKGLHDNIPSGLTTSESDHVDSGSDVGASANYDKPKTPRSGIPKRSIETVNDPAAARKPWIFGAHRNARVESVEYKRPAPDQLGFKIDEYKGYMTAPDARGFYVTHVDDVSLPIKLGDKILQIDGIDIDVDTMSVALVEKILSNCQETIQFLVSRKS